MVQSHKGTIPCETYKNSNQLQQIEINTRILKYTKMNCWRNVTLADKFDMSPEDAEKESRTFTFFSQRSQRSYGNRLIVEIVRNRKDH